MFAMFKQLFAAIQVFFHALESGARAVDHLATWGEETAGAFADESRIERTAKRKALLKVNGLPSMEALDAPVSNAPTAIKAKAVA